MADGSIKTDSAARLAIEKTKPDHEVIIIGGGFAGMGAAIELQKNGIDSYVLLERAKDVGGTWRDNRYPGIAVDISSFVYSFSFEQNPNWSRVFAPGSELQAYAKRVATKYGIYPKARFGVEVQRADFDEATHLWSVKLTNGEVLTGRYVVSATGGLISPKKPDIKGLDTFKGDVIHTGYWDDQYDFNGKRVAVIGTGATAVQMVPELAKKVSRLDVYQRTPIWVLKKPDTEIPNWLKTTFRVVPPVQKAVRLLADAVTESLMVGAVLYNRQIPGLVRWAESGGKNNLLEQIPDDPELRDKLTPKYGFGCKRPTFSNEYFKTYTLPHVELVTVPIDCVTETGVKTREGTEREIDVLITATGYRVFERGNLPSFEVYGRGGLELGLFWEQHRYQAYEGSTVPKFPNYFGMLGPYALTGSSYFKMVENHARHLVRCIKEAHKNGATCVEIRQGPHEAYFNDIQRRQQNTVFVNHSCAGSNSYYFDVHGDAPMLRPSTSLEANWRSRTSPLSHYEFTRVEAMSDQSVTA